jgi:soluble lytic murein transglycosylase
MSYYGALAARRLGTRNLHHFPDTVSYPQVPAVDSALQRIELLRTLHMTPEVGYENDRLFHDALTDHTRLMATAAAFAGTDQAGRAIALGRRALSDDGPSAAVYRLIYPLAARDTIIRSARAYGIDPILIASLIRQESNFNPRAVSPVGARGLMQLMPSVASRIAKRWGISDWSTEKLYQPGLNIMLGIAHLAPLVRSQPDIVRVLAAYNAGESRVARWAKKRAADDPEVFTERIPFSETRNYVKNIIRNRELYRALYTW